MSVNGITSANSSYTTPQTTAKTKVSQTARMQLLLPNQQPQQRQTQKRKQIQQPTSVSYMSLLRRPQQFLRKRPTSRIQQP